MGHLVLPAFAGRHVHETALVESVTRDAVVLAREIQCVGSSLGMTVALRWGVTELKASSENHF